MTMDPGGYLSTLAADPNGAPGETAGGVAVGKPMGGSMLNPATAGNTKAAPPYLTHPSQAAQENTFAPMGE